MGSTPVEALLSPRRRGWILFTAILATVMFSWASINRLSELVEAQDVPSDNRGHSLLELAEKNIASHLHIRTGEFSGNNEETVGILYFPSFHGCTCLAFRFWR